MKRLLAAVALGAAALGPSPAAHAAVPWCGTPETPDRVPDLVSAFHWHVVYAFPNDRPDRFAAAAPLIAGDAFEASAWWRGQDATRVPRFDLHEFPNCPSEFGRLDISRVPLPGPNSAYAEITRLLQDVIGQVERPPFAPSADKAYLVYYQGSLDNPLLCGVGGTLGRRFEPLRYAVVFLEACGVEANDGFRSLVAAHELVHGLGAVPPATAGSGPPNACPTDPGHVCDDSRDLLAASHSVGSTLADLTLDAGRNDYYGHGGSWFDVRSSSLFFNRLDGTDQAAPSAPVRPTATSAGTLASFSWQPARDDVGPVSYRIYNEDGSLRDRIETSSFSVESEIGATLAFHVRASDAVGFLSSPVTIRFRVGYGLVDEQDRLVRDTVQPGPVTRLRLRLRRGTVVATWRRAVDLGGLRGYRVRVGNRPYRLVRSTSVSIPLARAAGRLISVAAVDRGGNIGQAAAARAPRGR